MADHRTPFQKLWATVAGVVLLVTGVVVGAMFYGDTALMVVAAILAVAGLGLLRFALLRRTRAARG